jgi:hypothetical protein
VTQAQGYSKSADADVPEYLWEDHFLKDCPTSWILSERTRLRKAIGMLRAIMHAEVVESESHQVFSGMASTEVPVIAKN